MAQRNTFRDDEDLEEKINMRDLARVGVYLKPYMARVVWILIVVAAMGCINVVEPYLTKIMIDSVIPAKNLALLGELVALLAVLIVIYEFGLRYRTVEITRVGQLMLKDMRRDLFTHIQTLPFSYFDSRPHGKILIRVVNYVNTLSDTLSSGLVNVISDVFTFFITLVVMFVVDWRLALYSLALFPLLIAWVLGLQHFQRRAYQVLSNKQSNLNAFIHESIAGVKTTQTFAREDTQFRTFQEQQGAVRSAWMRTVHIQTLMWPGIQTISVMTIAFIYYVGVTGFGGVDVTKLSEHQRAKYIGRVFQDPMTGTAATMQIEENLALAARRGKRRGLRIGITKAERERYRELLKSLDLGLEDRLTARVGLLSGGQRQALTLLMATMNKPKLLLLDEHTAALDPKTALKVLTLSAKIVEENHLTTMMITHNMKDAIKYGNRLIMMHEGHIIYDVSGEEKKNLHVSDLLAKFQIASGGEFANDRMILS